MSEFTPTRRGFLAGLGTLVVAVSLPSRARAATQHDSVDEAGNLSVFVGIAEDGTVTMLSPAQEMGQGTSTGLAQCLADELDAAWEQVRVVHGDEKEEYRFAMVPIVFPKMQLTGGSYGLRQWRMPMREAGAKTRHRLVKAAAKRWGVPWKECTTALGVVRHPDGHEATYGELAKEAAAIKAPRKVKLKDPSQFTLMGKPVPREDLLGKVTGTTPYGIDVQLDDMVYASTVSCPVHRGTVKSVDDAAARESHGVIDVLTFDTFVAVVASSWWAADQAAQKLAIEWDDKGNGAIDNAAISKTLRAALDSDDKVLGGLKIGKVTAFHARMTGDNSGKSFMDGWFIKGSKLYWSLLAEGHMGMDFPYAFDHTLVEVVPQEFHIDTGFWRSVGQSYTAFFRESFIDELAHELGRDPLVLRRELLSPKQDRLRKAMDLCAEKAGWGKAPEGRFQGLSITDWGGTLSAQIVEISVKDDTFRVEKITAVLDCGLLVNPDQVKAQTMGGALMGLSSALGERVEFENGAATNTNFDRYHVLRMHQSPSVVDVHLIEGASDKPGPVGEPGTPPSIAGVCNAIFAATGKRVRTLPIPRTLSEIA